MDNKYGIKSSKLLFLKSKFWTGNPFCVVILLLLFCFNLFISADSIDLANLYKFRIVIVTVHLHYFPGQEIWINVSI